MMVLLNAKIVVKSNKIKMIFKEKCLYKAGRSYQSMPLRYYNENKSNGIKK